MERIGDLPAHPLVVHLPVVMIPLLALLTLLMAVRPGIRRTLSGWCAIAGVGTLVGTILAASSGQALADVFSEGSNYAEVIAEHQSQGEWLRLFALLFAVALIALWWFGRKSDSEPDSVGRSLMTFVTVLTVVAALASTAWVFRTGHSGATNSWGNALPTSALPGDADTP